MKDEQLVMVKELTEAAGLPGFEQEVRAVVRRYVADSAEITQDRLGSIIARRTGTADRPRIMLPGHIDEIGFMVTHVDDQGFLKFSQLGGWWDQVLLAQSVVVKGRKGDVPGIVGSIPPHILDPDVRNKVVTKDKMFIDVGARDRKEAEGKFGLRVGDPVVPDFPFTRMRNPKLLLAKAWDDRAGCALFIDALRALAGKKHPNTVFGVGTVQEEVGTRGARTSAHVVDPDVCIVLEVSIAGDVPGSQVERAPSKLGKGVSIDVLDGGMIPNVRLRDFVIEVAEKEKVPYQLCAMTGGATDGREVHLHGAGVPSICLGVPTRYIHSHAGILHADDYDSALRLLLALIHRLDAKTVSRFTE
jgi:endoglucanase